MLEVIAKLPTEGILLIEEQAISIIESFKQDTPSATESAGVLIGEYRESQHIRIVDATKPCKYDRSTRFSFDRRSPQHQKSVLSAWRSSGNTQTWIGEWHTHPEDHPTPSSKDIYEWKKALPNRPMIMLIQGRKTRWIGISLKPEIICITDYLN
ncbi:hypothetical protein AB835_14870 [Candidatus Endobugula sertula]|uniref:JAB domain-containing protein n=1 Tax=Candidatus Endobugula sertula TaxID=62101 RepID=A0A1D2QL73_9GAMM|nr:hypothetical protein AB835_14870 [Candidatus Endobugula sertula]